MASTGRDYGCLGVYENKEKAKGVLAEGEGRRERKWKHVRKKKHQGDMLGSVHTEREPTNDWCSFAYIKQTIE